MAAILDELTVATYIAHPDLNMNLLSRKSPATRYFVEHAVEETGRAISVDVRYKRNNGGSFDGADVLNTDDVDQFASGTVNWKSWYVNVTILETELVDNAGINLDTLMAHRSMSDMNAGTRYTIFNIAGKKLLGAVDDMDTLMRQMIYADGSGNSSKDMQGFPAFINSTTSYADIALTDLSTFSYKGFLSGSNDNIWAARSKSLSNADLTIEDLGAAIDDARRSGSGEMFVYMPMDLYTSLELILEGQRLRSNERNAPIGFANIEWPSKMTTFFGDDSCPRNTIYGVDIDHVKLKKAKSMWMHFGGWVRPHNQRVITAQLLCRGNMCCDDRAKCFVLSDVGTAA